MGEWGGVLSEQEKADLRGVAYSDSAEPDEAAIEVAERVRAAADYLMEILVKEVEASHEDGI